MFPHDEALVTTAAPRYVVAVAARPRAVWFSNLSQWANDGSLPIELIPCVGVAEILARVDASRPCSAVFVDASLSGFDRDALAHLRVSGTTVVVFRDPRSAVDWHDLGAHAVLDQSPDRVAILTALVEHAKVVRAVQAAVASEGVSPTSSPIRGSLTVVVGSGGTGTSTIAMALAECFGGIGSATPVPAKSPMHRFPHTFRRLQTTSTAARTRVLLGDFCLRAELGMLHDTQTVSPGLQEVLDLHRTANVEPVQVRDCCFRITTRGYDLLLGLRHRKLWTTIRPTLTLAAIHSLTSAYDHVVLDVDSDLEGEADCGSIDLEERNTLARLAISEADRVVAVGHASLKGLHSLCRLIVDLRSFGIPANRIVPVVNQAPRSPAACSAYANALADLVGGGENSDMAKPIFVGFHGVDDCIRSVAPLPRDVVAPLSQLTRHTSAANPQTNQPRFTRIEAGFLSRAGQQ